MRILTLSAQDEGGGAATVARALAEMYARRGHDGPMLVGTRRGDDVCVIELPDRGAGFGWARAALGARDAVRPWLGRVRGAGRLHEFLHAAGRPRRLVDRLRGVEDWTLPASWQVLDLAREPPDIVHAHNLHSFRGPAGHFDLRALVPLSGAVPLVLTLHDAWLTTGHCAHSLGCGRWETGCGACPDLRIYPPVRRDATARNWRRKQAVFAESRLYVATPSRWLMERVERSMLAPAVVEARVIPNGVDRKTFRPGDKAAARRALGLPHDALVLLSAGQAVTAGSVRDFPTLARAVARTAALLPDRRVLLVGLGEDLPPEACGAAEIRFVPYQRDRETVATHHRAADAYVHSAKAETFPTAILEAMACGAPVVASAVGGIAEQVVPETGILVPPGDAEAMARAVARIAGEPSLAAAMGSAAMERVRRHFDLEEQAAAYLCWFDEIRVSARRSRGGGVDAPGAARTG